jgi:hypothetical protein
MKDAGGLRLSWTGVLLVALGLLFLADQADWLDFGDAIRTWWPAILIVIGLSQLLGPSGSRLSGGVLIAIGAAFLLEHLGYLPVSVWKLWPLLLIAFGLSMMTRGRTPRPGEGGHEDVFNVSTVFGGHERAIKSQAFRGGNINTLFGGVDLDLREAALAPEGADVSVSSVFGGVQLRVPSGWDVRMEGTPIFGGLADERKRTAAPPPGSPAAPAMRLRCSVLFGGVSVKD